MSEKIIDFTQEYLLPGGLIGGGITAGYTKMLHIPLLNIFTDPALVSLVRDYISMMSLAIGTFILIYNTFFKKPKKAIEKEDNHEEKDFKYPKDTQSESNHDPV